MHNRRARPTLRVLSGDLTSDWSSPHPQRSLAEGRHADLHPLSELPHPIIAKAAECFPNDASNDNFVGPVLGATNLRLLEVKNSQWRGGVWEDDGTGVCWLVVAGLAKGGHEDHDDFYKDTYSTIGEIGCWAARVTALEEHNSRGTLAESVPGSTSHYSHKKHLADSTIDGTALRALCGAFFVPSRDHEVLPRCPTCDRRLAEFPQ